MASAKGGSAASAGKTSEKIGAGAAQFKVAPGKNENIFAAPNRRAAPARQGA
jgi:hypothetical protein